VIDPSCGIELSTFFVVCQLRNRQKIGVHHTTVGRKERGANVGQDYLQAAAIAYDCEVIDILERPPWESPSSQGVTISDQIIEAAKAEVGRVLKQSIGAMRAQPQALPASEVPPKSSTQAPPRGSKSSKKPTPPKRP
jgi:hypothetical protein